VRLPHAIDSDTATTSVLASIERCKSKHRA
jgi:hypothetical protein